MAKAWTTGALLTVLILLSELVTADRKCLELPQASVEQLDRIIVQLAVTMQWSSVTLLFNDMTGILHNVTDQLHTLHITTRILLHDEAINTTLELCLQDMDGAFVVVGSFDFVQLVFHQAAECAERHNRADALFTTEWLTVVEEVDMQQSLSVFNAFENVAFIVISKTGLLSLWTLRHVQDDSKLSLVIPLSTDVTPLTRRQHIYPNPSYGLGGRTLRMVTKEMEILVKRASNDNPIPYEGVAIEILHELSVRLNFSYVFVPPVDDSWGVELDNGQWDGCIGMLTRKEVDIAASLFSINEGRSSVADAVPYLYDNAVIMFTKQTTLNAWTFFIQPFQSTVYVVVGGCVMGALLLLLLLERCERVLIVREKAFAAVKVTWPQGIMEVLEVLYCGLLNKSSASKRTSRASDVLIATWMFLGMVLTSLYSSKLTSSLTVRQEADPFTSLDEMLNQQDYVWGFASNSAVLSLLKTSTDPQLQHLYQGALKFARSDPSILSGNTTLQLEKVAAGNYAYVMDNAVRYHVLLSEHCDVTKLPDVSIASPFGFYLQKGSPYSKLISNEITKMMDGGLIDHWIRKWAPEKKQCDPDVAEGERVIGLEDIQTAFYLAAIGLAVAFLTLGSERVVSQYFPMKTA